MSSRSEVSPYPAPGEIIGDSWRVEKIMGEGGMGAVARAYNLVLHTPVAIKFMNPQFLTFPGAVERFINEGKASALIKSDHVVPVMQAGKTAAGTPYLVMECLEGVDLADLLRRDGSPGLPIERAVHFVLQALRALQAAHAIGIIHRDMKPSNCFAVNKDGEEDFVKILDFGISKIQQPGSASLTQTNSALGTPLYMSPEQARSPRDVDARSDLYSVGVILYELLTGNTPFSSDTGEFTEILFKLFTTDPPPVKSVRLDLPDDLANAVHKALARDVKDRFTSALDMAEAIAPFASERSKHVLTRMRAFKAPLTMATSAPKDLPQSMVAFSQLSHARGASTDAMSGRPATELMKAPPATEMMDHAPGKVPADSRAPTQFDTGRQVRTVAHPMPAPRTVLPEASTDLGASRDATAAEAPERKRSPLIFALPVVAVVAISGVFLALGKGSGKGTGGATATPSAVVSLPGASGNGGTTNALPPPLSTVAPPSSSSPTSTATADAGSSPVGSTTSSTVRTQPRLPPRTVDPPPPPLGTSVLDTKIKQ